ncbi:hypothetical protein PI125_g1530 [Phytophthora idaei]|nr:hypothetical protein PI125_g1530 [Phytophthora idaei]
MPYEDSVLELVHVSLSMGLIPRFGVCLVLFQLPTGVERVLTSIDTRLANMVSKREPKPDKTGNPNWATY